MKKYVPLKYILKMIALFIVIPISFILLLVFVVGLNKLTIAICIFFGFIIISGLIVFIRNQESASIIVEDGRITNNINDGTSNFGWSEDIKNIKSIKVTNNEEARKYYKNCKSKKVLLIDFGSYNIKYISINLFTNKQINQILKHLRSMMSFI